MDIKTLKSFVAVAKYESFSQAAQELHTVQPAISRHISSLEDELGVSLFHRNSRDVTITPAGEQLLKDARTILALTEQAKAQAKLAHTGEMGTLNIGYLSSGCFSFMASLIRSYKSQFPRVHVSLYEMTVTEQIEALANETIDIAFSRPLPTAIRDDYASLRIYVDKLVAIVSQNHEFADRKSIPLIQLKDEAFIIFNRDEALGLFNEIIMQCQHAGFSPDLSSQPRRMQTLLTEVAAGLGVAIAPNCVKKLYSEGCHFIELEDVKTQIPLEMQYKSHNQKATVSEFAKGVSVSQKGIQDNMENA